MLAWREDGAGDDVVLCLHGYPESAAMWRHLLPDVAAAGWRAIAPDLSGFGDSPPADPATWTGHVERLEEFRNQLELPPVVLVVHDWGGLIGLRWACDHRDAVRALVISDTGFFPDGKWHGLADAMRTPGTGEELIGRMELDGFRQLLAGISRGIDDDAVREYFKAFADDERRAGQLALYRSGEFAELEAYDGRLAALGVPALLLWGADDAFAPVAGAHRFRAMLGDDAELVVLDGAGHFVFEDEPARCSAAVLRFLERVRPEARP